MVNLIKYFWIIGGIYLYLRAGVINAQEFNIGGGKIIDFEAKVRPTNFRIKVKDLPTTNKDFGLVKVCLNISHKRSSDLKIYLTNPAGNSIWLSNRNGGKTGEDFSQTCFSQTGFFGYIHKATNPFAGEYIPDGRFEVLSQNIKNLNGDWTLTIEDLRAGVTGELSYVTLFFGKTVKPKLGKCSEANPKYCKCEGDKKNGDMLPDLIILPSFTQSQIEEYAYNDANFPRQIKFAATIANIGYGPMEIRGSNKWFCGQTPADSMGICNDGSYSRQPILQKIYFKKKGKIFYREIEAGTNYFDSKPGHNHFHVDNWVEFSLKKVLSNGKDSTICKGEKVSYCLFDSGICNAYDDLCDCNQKKYNPTTLVNYGFGNYINCQSGVQGISVGGYDTYGYMYEGQSLTLPENTPNGKYILEIKIDPENKYLEGNKSNNTYRQIINLKKQS